MMWTFSMRSIAVKLVVRAVFACVVLCVFPRSSFPEQSMDPLRVRPTPSRFFATPDFDCAVHLDFMARHGHNFMRL